ncbi:MAG: polysaccharide biosynthesis protein, partial [Clostridia bacterium]|nr:polysaccharide biosynthesis protein [Clostridia bacterium]
MFERLMPKNKTARMMILLLVDIVLLALSSFVALWSRFDLSVSAIPEQYLHNALIYLPIYIVVSIIVFYLFRLYSYMWSVAGMREAASVIMATFFSMVFQICGMNLLNLRMPRSYYIICFFVISIFEAFFRFSFRIHRSVRSMLASRRQVNAEKPAERIMLVGAGVAGADILKEIRGSGHVVGDVVCFIDDEKNKVGRFINGVKIVGTRKDIPEMVKRYDVDWIYITMPSATREERSQIAKICQETGVKTKTLPGIYQLVNGEVSVSRLRNVSIEDLLGRDPIEANFEKITTYLKDKVVLVTGGGGSIGSELCRQIAKAEPKKLIVFDIYENSVYELQHELQFHYPNLDAEYLIGSVRNIHRLDTIFEQYRPEIVFHAAAHKHVPLMEDSPNEAIKNNVMGTYKLAKAAAAAKVGRFVLISTDKAVNPTNIMGASKRICEMVIQMLDRECPDTVFSAVRFGNVLGSNGSVIPLFKKQIEKGGPVTVTDPNVIRYFMTIPEA